MIWFFIIFLLFSLGDKKKVLPFGEAEILRIKSYDLTCLFTKCITFETDHYFVSFEVSFIYESFTKRRLILPSIKGCAKE